ncbi:hypothetical protein F4821DRAFT_175654 [Hypoxylon rubiginosum]|uniref:Uncharacterized protein n=1 Tax=Hypoxylon rubiginosum TaxID=110542 RepID=A0ACC0CV49_9PEZI|nr:hypothetical protein F4821DRAFT_175654 [Hypoxylon rubiginosum]
MNYPRRRAPIACNFCRQRKRKCDGHKPACRLCHAAGITCDYQDVPNVSSDSSGGDSTANRSSSAQSPGPSGPSGPSTDDLLRRLDELESLVRRQNTASASSLEQSLPRTPQMPQLPQFTNPPLYGAVDDTSGLHPFLASIFTPPAVFPTPQSQHQMQAEHPPSTQLGAKQDAPSSDWISTSVHGSADDEPLTIPIGHLTPTSSLFSLDPVKRLIGEYPEDYFFQIEAERYFQPEAQTGGPGGHLNVPNLDKDTVDNLLASFFSEIYPHFPILDRDWLRNFFDVVITDPSADEVDRALCFTILALGKLASNRQACSPGEYTDDDGVEYFSRAYHTLITRWITSFNFGLSLPSGLLYSAVYLCYLERPLHSWQLVHMASVKLQLMVTKLNSGLTTRDENDILLRLCWACFLLECDSLAEFHLPRSGIELLIDSMPFPCFSDRIDQDGLSFLVICSVRRLLNRIHRAIYAGFPKWAARDPNSIIWNATEPHEAFWTVGGLESICSELSHQLDSWYHSLPESIKPDFSDDVPRSRLEGWLRLRYWFARHIICRPCLVYAATLPDQLHLPPYVLKYSEMCVESCRKYIITASFVLKERTQYTWMTIQASLACAFVITIASGSPLLCHLVPDIKGLRPGSSAESIGWILNTISQKQRLTIRLISRPSFSMSSSARSINS